MISLIVPVYNVRSYIEEFLQSVVGQTYEDYEALLIDDGSNDGTETILDEYAKKYDKLKVSHKENGGVISAWKMGIEIARGEYIAFADPDDILLPNMLDIQHDLMVRHNVDVVISCYFELSGKCQIYRVSDMIGLDDGIIAGIRLDELKHELFGRIGRPYDALSFFRWNKLFKRKVILDNLKYSQNEVSFGEDVCISASAIYDSVGLYYTRKPLYIYRIRNDSLTTNLFSEKQITNALVLVNSVRKMTIDRGYYNEFVEFAYYSYHICYLIKKAVNSGNKFRALKLLKDSMFVKSFDLRKAKSIISANRYKAIHLLKSRLWWLLGFAVKV